MPLKISSGFEQGPIQQLPEQSIEAAESPALGEVFTAGFEQENSLVSWASKGFSFGESFAPIPGYDFSDDVAGYEVFAESFIDSESPEQTAHIKMQLDHEIENKNTLAAAGWQGVVAQMAAGATDPIYLPLMFTGLGSLKPLSSGKAFASAAAIGAASEVPAEFAKHATQETRTGEESAFNIGGASLFSGVIGAGASTLTRQEFKTLGKKMDEVLLDTSPRSVGAAQVRRVSDENLDIIGVGIVDKARVSPNVRLATSKVRTSKMVANELMESSLVIKGAKEGETAIPLGGSVETRVKMWDAPMVEALEDLDGFYSTYRGGMGKAKRVANDYVMQNKAGKLTPGEFRVEVGKAMRRGDEHKIPEVAEAARTFRQKVFDPLKDAAINERLLPEDVDVSTATSYLTRIYNHKKIVAKRPEWDKTIEDWFKRGRQKSLNELETKKAEGKKISESLHDRAYVSDEEIMEASNSITNNILGDSSGRSSYNVKATVKGPLNERVLNIPDSMIEDFLESDIDLVSRQYTRTMAPDVEITKQFGNIDMQIQRDYIIDDYETLITNAKTEAERAKLDSLKKSDLRDVDAVRDMLRGTYRVPNDPDAFFIRAGRTLRDVNFLRMLGGMTMSAIPDLARPVAANGLKPVARAMKSLALSPKTFNMSRLEAKKAAVGLDMVLNSRASSLADVADIYASGSQFERGLRTTSDAFGKMTLMTQWNTALKQFSGVVTQDRILAEAVNWSNGSIKKGAIKRLAASGIDEDIAVRIAQQFKKHGDDGDLLLSNGHLWDDTDALEAFRAAVLRDVDRTILTPGVGEKPLWTSSETGKMIFQFKTFAATAHHKILIADLQYADAAALNGFLLSVALGTATYGAKQYVADRPIETDSKKLIIESLDRSGAFGYFWDVNNSVEKLTRGSVGVNALAGAPPMSRYASRNLAGALLGPSLGTVQDITDVTGAITEGEFTEKELHKMRKLLPGQNLFYMRQLLNSLEEKVAEEL